MRTRFFLLIFLGAAHFTHAQDLHFSQPYHMPLQFTPAQTGAFEGDLRVMGIYRSQWSSVPVSYRTMGLAADRKVWQRGSNSVNAGLMVAHDKAGDAGLSWTQLGLSGSVSRALTEEHALMLGFGLNLVQRRFDIGGLTFKNQWTGDVFDASLPTKETFNQSSGMAPSLSAGLNWHFQQSRTRTQANIGAGAAHLNKPSVSFNDQAKARLPLRLSFLANSAVELNESFDLIVFAMGQRMQTAQEIVVGSGGRLWLTPGQTALQFTLAARLGDAVIPAIQYEFGEWAVGLSYDWNTSPYKAATGGRGGFEIAVVYRTLPAPPVKTFKSCPLF